MSLNLSNLSGSEIAHSIKSSGLNKEQAYSYFKDRISLIDPKIKSFIESYPGIESTGGVSSLSGVPIAIKDNMCIKGKKITCSSKILNSHISVYDGTVIERLKEAGLSILGTTNMDEFAFGSSTETSCYGVTKNPWDQTCVPGGSSGGSAAAVAARLVPFALGSDTGGSIRQPASFCGVVGMKPTYGRVSRYGLIAFGSSLDQIGPITTNFTDCANLLNIISGHDKRDSTSSRQDVPDFTKSLNQDVKGIRIGIPKEYYEGLQDKEVKAAVDATIALYEKLGAKIVEISLPHTEYAVATYYIIAPSEASANLQRFDSIKYGLREKSEDLISMYKKTRASGFGDEAKRRIFIGTYSLSSGYYEAYYVKALKVRTLIKQDFQKAFKEVDVILTPTAPTPAFTIGEKKDPLSMYLSDVYTISVNLAGNCAVSFPCGFSKKGLPIGAQLIGKSFDEETIIKMGFTYQENTDFHKKVPSIAS